MLALELDGAELDYCSSCAGLWLDEEEIVWLVDRAPAAGELSSLLARGDVGERGAKPCARCNQPMHLDRLDGVEIDRCSAGHGIWFDPGELEAFLAGSSGGQAAAAAVLIGRVLGKRVAGLDV